MTRVGTAVILCGGRSSRAGLDKQAALVPEETVRRFSPGWDMVAGINTRADVERFLQAAVPR